MTIAKARAREVLGHAQAEAEAGCVCDNGRRKCCTSDCSLDTECLSLLGIKGCG